MERGTDAAYLSQLGVDGGGIDDKDHAADLALKLGQAETELLVAGDVHDVQGPQRGALADGRLALSTRR